MYDSHTGCGRRPVLRLLHTTPPPPLDNLRTIDDVAAAVAATTTDSQDTATATTNGTGLREERKEEQVAHIEQEYEFSNVFYIPLKVTGFDTIEIYLKDIDWNDLDSSKIEFKTCVLHFQD